MVGLAGGVISLGDRYGSLPFPTLLEGFLEALDSCLVIRFEGWETPHNML